MFEPQASRSPKPGRRSARQWNPQPRPATLRRGTAGVLDGVWRPCRRISTEAREPAMKIWHRTGVLLAIVTAVTGAAAQAPPDTLARLTDRCADIRLTAVQHTTSINGRPTAAAIAQLVEMLKTEPFPNVREQVVASLGLLKPLEPFAPSLIAALDDSTPQVSSRAA